MKRFEETLEVLRKQAAISDSVVVSYSGGKDAMVVLDLCVRTFKRVEAFYMYLVPGLQVIDDLLDQARRRYPGLVIRQYPHWIVAKSLKFGVYCPCTPSQDKLPNWKLKDIRRLAMAESGINCVATGERRADSLARRLSIGKTILELTPIAGWVNADVFGYLKMRNLPLPDSSGRQSTGITLAGHNLCWLHDKYPADFAKVEAVFPFCRAAVVRRDLYGIVD